MLVTFRMDMKQGCLILKVLILQDLVNPVIRIEIFRETEYIRFCEENISIRLFL